MKSHDNILNGQLTDPAVSASYRASSGETTPVELDRKIMRTANNEVKATASTAWSLPWLRPATFAATLGLSIALLMEFSEVQDLAVQPDIQTYSDPIGSPPMPAARAVPDRISNNDAGAVRGEANASSPSARRQENAVPQQMAPAPKSPQAAFSPRNSGAADADSFRDAADATAKQVREVDATASANLQQMPKLESESVPAVSGIAAEEPSCTEEQRKDAEEWWRCIDDLIRAGLAEQAELERLALHDKFPAFSLP
jgi:hypothetical protein